MEDFAQVDEFESDAIDNTRRAVHMKIELGFFIIKQTCNLSSVSIGGAPLLFSFPQHRIHPDLSFRYRHSLC